MRMQSDGNSFFEWWDENNVYHQVVADGDAALPDDNPQWIRETSKEYVQDSLLLEHLGGDANISFDKDGDASVTVGNNGKTHTFKNFECVHAIADEGQTVTFHAGGFLASTVVYDQEAPWKHLSVGANEHDDPGTYVFDLGWNADPLSAAGNVSFYAGGGASGDIFMVGSTENDFGNIQLSGGQGNDTYKLRAEGHAVTILDNAFGNKQGQVPSGADTVQFFGVDSNFEVNSLRFFWSGDKTGGGTLKIANVDGKWGALGPNSWPNNTLTICYSNLLDKNTVTYGNLQGDHMQFFGNSETNLLADVDLNSVVTAMTGKDRSWDDNCQGYSTGWVQLSFTDGKVS
ncbi:MAG: hypothetical protein K6F46_11785 [Desulfovibrio sp.]|nr:hypothetical protein [Desulfovibrio sp.]